MDSFTPYAQAVSSTEEVHSDLESQHISAKTSGPETLAKSASKNKTTKLEDINAHLRAAEPFLDPSGIKYVEFYLTTNGITIVPTKMFVGQNGIVLDYSDLERKIILAYQRDYKNLTCPGKEKIQPAMLRLATREVFNQKVDLPEGREALVRLLPIFRTSTTNNDLILDVVELLTGERDRVIATIFRQFIWQVKRKIRGLPIFDPIIIVLVGPQDVGKTGFLNIFLSPLGGFTAVGNLNELLEPRALPLLEKRFVTICNEFTGIQKVDMNLLKEIITESRYTVRKFQTQEELKFNLHSSFIGTSNTGLIDQVFDSTGVRRFFEVRIPRLIDFSKLGQINMEDVWKSVDETTNSSPSAAIKDAIRERQAKFRNKDDVTIFMEEIGAFKSDQFGNSVLIQDEPLKAIGKDLLYFAFKQWAERGGLKAISKISFGKRLTEKHVQSGESKAKGAPRYHWLLPESINLPVSTLNLESV